MSERVKSGRRDEATWSPLCVCQSSLFNFQSLCFALIVFTVGLIIMQLLACNKIGLSLDCVDDVRLPPGKGRVATCFASR